MKINYVSLGSFCHPKNIIRSTNREYLESLPFDFLSSPNLSGITTILRELYEKKTYDIELSEVLCLHNDNKELAVTEKNGIYLVHFLKKEDLIEPVENFPCPISKIKKDAIISIKKMMKRRFERLYRLLNQTNEILCFLRIENYENPLWESNFKEFCDVLSLYKNNNKYLMYIQNAIDNSYDYRVTNQINYSYSIPVMFFKDFLYDKILIGQEQNLIKYFNYFEELMLRNDNVITIEYNGLVEKYFLDKDKNKIFKLTKLSSNSDYYMDEKVLILNNALTGNENFHKNIETNIFHLKQNQLV